MIQNYMIGVSMVLFIIEQRFVLKSILWQDLPTVQLKRNKTGFNCRFGSEIVKEYMQKQNRTFKKKKKKTARAFNGNSSPKHSLWFETANSGSGTHKADLSVRSRGHHSEGPDQWTVSTGASSTAVLQFTFQC